MAFEQKWIDRYKAEGFFKHIEWASNKGVLVRLYTSQKKVTFETGVFDVEYDQNLPDCRQFFLPRRDAVKFMLNLGLSQGDIISVFQNLNSVEPVVRFI